MHVVRLGEVSHIYIYTWLDRYVDVNNIPIYINTYIYIYIHTYVYLTYHIYMYICTNKYIYIYIYILMCMIYLGIGCFGFLFPLFVHRTELRIFSIFPNLLGGVFERQ